MKKQFITAIIFVLSLVYLTNFGCNINKGRLEAFLQTPRSPVSGTEYIVLPPDVLEISSIYITEINGLTQQVRPDGKIVLPLLGNIMVAGQTPEEIEKLIIEAAQEYYKKADATVKVIGYNSQKYYVFGQVSRPGPFRWTGCDTFLDALAVSQPTDLSWPEYIKVIRAREPTKGGYLRTENPEDPNSTEREYIAAGKNKAGADEVTINLRTMVEKGDLSHNLLLRPDDVIFVPPNPFAAVGLALRTVLFPTRPVIEAVRLPYDFEYYSDIDRSSGRYRR